MSSEQEKRQRERERERMEIASPKMGAIDSAALALPEGKDLLFRFAVYGDNQRGIAVHRRIVDEILASGAKLVLHVGDYVTDGRDDTQWELQFKEPARPLLEKLIFIGVLGNHDRNSPRYYEIIKPPGGRPWFKVEHNSVAFFGVDTNGNLRPNGEQGRWFARELKKCDLPWKVVFLHEAPYSSSWPWPGGALKTRKQIMPFLEKYGVDLVVAGHIHNYERFHKDGIPYFIAGGGGDTLSKPEQLTNPYKVWTAMIHHFLTVDVYEDRLAVLARDLCGIPFDGLTIEKGGGLKEMDIPTRRGYDGPWPTTHRRLHFGVRPGL